MPPSDSQTLGAAAGRPETRPFLTAAFRWGVCVAYVALVTWLTLAPSRVFNSAPSLFSQADKLAHFLMYGFFVVVVRWALMGSGLRWRPAGFWVPLAALVYGALMELAQLLLVTEDRSFEVGDMLANGLGALLFWGMCNLWGSRRQQTAARAPGVSQAQEHLSK